MIEPVNYDREYFHYLLMLYLSDPDNEDYNFNMGLYYHSIGQTASAVSFYIRTAERAYSDLLVYEALIRAGMCFEDQGCRNHTVEGVLQHAVALCPQRPEGYYYLSRHYEKREEWANSYLFASMGEKLFKKDLEPLRTDVNFTGYTGLLFQKAVSGYWMGLGEETLSILKKLISDYAHKDYDFYYLIAKNINKLEGFTTKNFYYSNELQDKVKYKFEGLQKIEKNYSQAFQDMFILYMLDGKRRGSYVEIGSGDPFENSNTALLETVFDWKGLSIDIDDNVIELFKEKRNNTVVKEDATLVDFKKLLKKHKIPIVVDYLQIDCDPAEKALECLKRFPFDEYQFKVITFEHDHYCVQNKYSRDLSREIFKKHGYELVVANVSPDEWKVNEDWYINPNFFSRDKVESIKNINSRVLDIKYFMLDSITP